MKRVGPSFIYIPFDGTKYTQSSSLAQFNPVQLLGFASNFKIVSFDRNLGHKVYNVAVRAGSIAALHSEFGSVEAAKKQQNSETKKVREDWPFSES